MMLRGSLPSRAVTGPARCGRRARKACVCRAEEGDSPSTTSTSADAPDWLPGQAGPIVDFLASDDFRLQDTQLYSKYLKSVVEQELFAKSLGWKAIPEAVNGRAAMIGFVGAAGAEIFGSGSVLAQISKSPQAVLLLIGVIVAGSIIPKYKGVNEGYLSSLLDTYGLPEDWFTATNEKIHGRLAMLGFGALISIELLMGRALF